MDIRLKTGLIVRKDGEYLQCMDVFRNLIWSVSPWDAWITRDIRDARNVAEKVNGEMMLFNPIAGQLRTFGEG